MGSELVAALAQKPETRRSVSLRVSEASYAALAALAERYERTPTNVGEVLLETAIRAAAEESAAPSEN